MVRRWHWGVYHCSHGLTNLVSFDVADLAQAGSLPYLKVTDARAVASSALTAFSLSEPSTVVHTTRRLSVRFPALPSPGELSWMAFSGPFGILRLSIEHSRRVSCRFFDADAFEVQETLGGA